MLERPPMLEPNILRCSSGPLVGYCSMVRRSRSQGRRHSQVSRAYVHRLLAVWREIERCVVRFFAPASRTQNFPAASVRPNVLTSHQILLPCERFPHKPQPRMRSMKYFCSHDLPHSPSISPHNSISPFPSKNSASSDGLSDR